MHPRKQIVGRKTKSQCNVNDIALKTFFLGPQAENIDQVSEVFAHLISRWSQYRRSRFPEDGPAITSKDQASPQFRKSRERVSEELDRLIDEFENEIPKFSPRYLGHMFSEISLPSLYASFLSLLHNPNNISHESSTVGLKIEREAIAALIQMIGFKSEVSRGHFTSCGTIANLEGALRARNNTNSHPKIAMFLPRHAHYSWEKIASILGLSRNNIFWIDLDGEGRMSPEDLNRQIQIAIKLSYRPFLVVSVFGSTEFGICDSVHKISNVCKKWKTKNVFMWHHVDAAYGGFFASLKSISNSRILSKGTLQSLRAISAVDSVTIDPHKLGYAPFAAGVFLCRSSALYHMPSLNTPYLAKEMDKSGAPWTVEGSRSSSGALAVALTSRILSFKPKGFGNILRLTIQSRNELIERMSKIKNIRILPTHDLNILAFVIAKRFEKTSKVSRKTRTIFHTLSPQNRNAPYFLTKTRLDRERYAFLFNDFTETWNAKVDSDLEVLRLCAMNPFLISKEPKINYLDRFVETLKRLSE